MKKARATVSRLRDRLLHRDTVEGDEARRVTLNRTKHPKHSKQQSVSGTPTSPTLPQQLSTSRLDDLPTVQTPNGPGDAVSLSDRTEAQGNTLVIENVSSRNLSLERLPADEHREESQTTRPNLWKEAFDRLEATTQAQIRASGYDPESSDIQETSTLNSIFQDLEQKGKLCEAKSWTWKTENHEYIIRDVAAKCATWVKVIGDLVIPFAPSQAAGPWGLVKVLLEIPVTFSQEMLALLGTAERVLQVMHYSKVYESVFSVGNDDVLRQKLVNVYQAVFELLAHSVDLLSKPKLLLILASISNKPSGLFSDLTEKEDQLKTTIHACEIQYNAVNDEKMLVHLEIIQGHLPRIESQVKSCLEALEKTKAAKILTWISPVRYGTHHRAIKRTDRTCEWLIKHSTFQDWEQSSPKAILWLQGSPGVGKTFLTSRVVDHVQKYLEGMPNDEGFAYFYCNRAEETRRRPLDIARSYVRQLASSENKGSLFIQSRISTLHDELDFQGRDLDFELCQNLLADSLNLYPRTTLVLDAFDECDPASREQLLGLFQNLFSASRRPVKLFIASRPDADIRYWMSQWPHITIQATDNFADIEVFIDERLGQIVVEKGSKVLQDPEVKERITSTLFQWTYLQLEQLRGCTSREDILGRLGMLPSTLGGVYSKIYEEIENSGPHDRALAERALILVLAAFEPLDSRSLLRLIRIDPDLQAPEMCSEVTDLDLLALCRNLLILDKEEHIWRFSHLSVAEYLETRPEWTAANINLMASRACLLMLMYDPCDVRPTPDSEQPTQHTSRHLDNESNASPCDNQSSVDYSSDGSVVRTRSRYGTWSLDQPYEESYWAEHILLLKQHTTSPDALVPLVSLLETFLGAPFAGSLRYQKYAGIGKQYRSLTAEWPIVTVIILGLSSFLERWWQAVDLDPESLETRELKDLIILVANEGDVPILRSPRNRLEMVRFLMEEAGANVNMESDGLPLPIRAAFSEGHIDVAQFLLSKWSFDANMQLNHDRFGSVLAYVSYADLIEGAKLLVEQYGASVDLPLTNGMYGSALSAAASSWPSKKVLTYFVEAKRADVNLRLKCGLFGSALAAAVEHGDPCRVQYLLEVGKANANMPLPGFPYGSALARATCHAAHDPDHFKDWAEIVRALMAAGASVILDLGNGEVSDALETFYGNLNFGNWRDSWMENWLGDRIIVEEDSSEGASLWSQESGDEQDRRATKSHESWYQDKAAERFSLMRYEMELLLQEAKAQADAI
ncbi:unnamed protein product [Penicillium salamii]|nr:unnamed protein product [Penicillium salamii]CAG8375130.1 unnamed protein product [Penicillium salamii]